MSLFDDILDKLGIKKKPAVVTPPAPASPRATGTGYTPSAGSTAAGKAPLTPAAVPVVDVMSKLEGMAKKYPMKLNWKESIVDLLVLLDLPHGANDLKELAVDLKCPANILDDSFKRNMWLHKATLKAIADNGGNIPRNLLD